MFVVELVEMQQENMNFLTNAIAIVTEMMLVRVCL